MKLVYKFIFFIFFITVIFLSYLSIIGIETDKFNNQIKSKVNNINKDFKIELKKIKVILDPFKLKLNVKTVGSILKNQNHSIEIDNIKTQISIKAWVKKRFLIENLEISSKSLELNTLIPFLRSIKNSTELFILEKVIKKGSLIADIKLEFDREGKIKDNYEIDGFVKDVEVSFLKKYYIRKFNFLFKYKKDNLILEDALVSLNGLNFLSNNLLIKNINDGFLINGEIYHKNLDFDKKNLELFIEPFFENLSVEKLKFSSKNIFSFKLNKKFKPQNLKISSEMILSELAIKNNMELKSFFPKIKDSIFFRENKLTIDYEKDDLLINGSGNILIQNDYDFVTYNIEKKNNLLNFESSLELKENPLTINFLNYEKNQEVKSLIKFKGKKNNKNIIIIEKFSFREKNDKIEIKDLKLNKKFKVINISKANLDYIDKDQQKNSFILYKKNKEYFLEGQLFNANKLIDDLLDDSETKSNVLNFNNKINVNLKKIYLDNKNDLKNFVGYFVLSGQDISKANLVGNFIDNKRFNFTINSKLNNKITTLYIDQASPIISRYKFIKGFEEGSLDFYSSKNSNKTVSTLKIYNFKLKELPVLTKILTLASLQGIADILSGEGIRFDEFEMNFMNKDNLTTINEIYAIGPAISILMDGYVEKNKLISLRGTLVPATTINKVIGTIPILGKILVGTKTGEGVFGVSFKIKGPPKNLETTVNPIKTLTPRFITRTLEKIKKN